MKTRAERHRIPAMVMLAFSATIAGYGGPVTFQVNMSAGEWQDVPDTAGVNAITIPFANASEFYRLAGP